METRFGKWVVLKRLPDKVYSRHRLIMVLARCDCGIEKAVFLSSLTNGKSTRCSDCGHRKHGMTKSMANQIPEYRIWAGMRSRCHRKDKNSKNYGDRGIVVCDRWSDFGLFYSDMGLRPSGAHSIDRIDNEGPYSPDNCRWATQKEQSRNTRRNNWITSSDGRRMLISEWAALTGKPESTIRFHMKRGVETDAAVGLKCV